MIVFTHVISRWKCNRIRDGFRFFRKKAASLQAMVGRIQAGHDPFVSGASSPGGLPDTPTWIMSGASSPKARRRSVTSYGSQTSLSSMPGNLRSPSQDSELSFHDADAANTGFPGLLKAAIQNEALISNSSSAQTTPRSP